MLERLKGGRRGVRIGVRRQCRSVVPVVLAERIDAADVQPVTQRHTCRRQCLLERKGHRQERRSGIKGVPFRARNAKLATNLSSGLKDEYVAARGSQPHAGPKAADSRTDDDDAGHAVALPVHWRSSAGTVSRPIAMKEAMATVQPAKNSA